MVEKKPIRSDKSRPAPVHAPHLSSNMIIMILPATLVAILAGLALQSRYTTAWSQDQIPDQAQFISPKSWAVLDQVPSPDIANGTTVCHLSYRSIPYAVLTTLAVLYSTWHDQRVTEGETFPSVLG